MAFDERSFLSVSGMKLAEYAQMLELSGYEGLGQDTLHGMLQQSSSMQEEHAMYVILWAIRFGLLGSSDAAVAFLSRGAPWHGPQAEVLKALHDAPDLNQRHLDAITPRKLAQFHTAQFPDIFPELIEKLRRRLAR